MMLSTLPRSAPSRAQLRSKAKSSGPLSKSTLWLLAPRVAVSKAEKPWTAQHRQRPDEDRRPRRAAKLNSLSTFEGVDDRPSVALSTRTWISSRSTGLSIAGLLRRHSGRLHNLRGGGAIGLDLGGELFRRVDRRHLAAADHVFLDEVLVGEDA